MFLSSFLLCIRKTCLLVKNALKCYVSQPKPSHLSEMKYDQKDKIKMKIRSFWYHVLLLLKDWNFVLQSKKQW